MKKPLIFFVFLSLLLSLSIQTQAQSTVSVNVGGDESKSASQARSIALTNTVSSIGVGVATVAMFENNTIETAGAALGVYGLIMGPSTGNFYAKDYKRGMIGMAARTVGAYLMVDATREIFGNDFADALTVDDREVSLTDTKILIGEALVLGSLLYNIFSTNASVEQYNQGRGYSIRFDANSVHDTVAPVLTAQIRL